MNRAERRKAAKEQRNNNIGRNTNSKHNFVDMGKWDIPINELKQDENLKDPNADPEVMELFNEVYTKWMGSTLVKNLYSKVLITLGMEYLDTLTSLKFDLIAVKTSDGDNIVSMQVNKCEEYENEYEFSQTCIGFDGVAYHLKKDDIISAEGEYNTDADTLYITCKLKNSLTVYFMIINVSGSENRTDKYDEMDVYQLNDFLEDVLHEKNEYYCVFTRITDVFGFDLKMRNCIRTYVNTLDDSDWKLHISDDFTSFEVPVTDDSINEIYVKDNAESRSIIVKPYNQPFMEIDMLFFKKHN